MLTQLQASPGNPAANGAHRYVEHYTDLFAAAIEIFQEDHGPVPRCQFLERDLEDHLNTGRALESKWGRLQGRGWPARRSALSWQRGKAGRGAGLAADIDASAPD